MKPKYKRIMLKLSGEILLGRSQSGISAKVLKSLCEEIAELKKLGCEITIVMGGGNIWRYRNQRDTGLDRVTLDNMGMLATIMNALAMRNCFELSGVSATVASAVDVEPFASKYNRRKALCDLNKGKIVICAGGTGNPFFTTDTAAALRSLELNCEVLLKATNVDGVYDKDPKKYRNAKKFDKISWQEVIEKNLGFMDQTAVSLCMEGCIPIVVFNLGKKGNLKKAVIGEKIGTIVHF